VFNDSVNIGILANKAATARELLGRLQTAYENLPKWMQQGIIAWNKGSLELENGSKILAASTSASASQITLLTRSLHLFILLLLLVKTPK
jgi:hypothetical protein